MPSETPDSSQSPKSNAPARRIALYARNSVAPRGWVPTAEQPEPPGSWKSQLARLREWAPAHGFSVWLERYDLASGRRVDRPGLEEVMSAARARHVHAVAVVKVDRWARSVSHLAASVEEFHKLGVQFFAVDQGIAVRKGDPTSKLILDILGSVAEWEASIISERTRDALQALKESGVRLGHPEKPCDICGGDRTGHARLRKKWGGRRVNCCAECKRLASPGDPAKGRYIGAPRRYPRPLMPPGGAVPVEPLCEEEAL